MAFDTFNWFTLRSINIFMEIAWVLGKMIYKWWVNRFSISTGAGWSRVPPYSPSVLHPLRPGARRLPAALLRWRLWTSENRTWLENLPFVNSGFSHWNLKPIQTSIYGGLTMVNHRLGLTWNTGIFPLGDRFFIGNDWKYHVYSWFINWQMGFAMVRNTAWIQSYNCGYIYTYISPLTTICLMEVILKYCPLMCWCLMVKRWWKNDENSKHLHVFHIALLIWLWILEILIWLEWTGMQYPWWHVCVKYHWEMIFWLCSWPVMDPFSKQKVCTVSLASLFPAKALSNLAL